MTRRTKQSGFIALISILIISMVLLFAVFSIGQKGIASRFMLLDLERKIQSEELANGCVQIAVINIANDSHHQQLISAEYPVGTSKCTLHKIQPNGTFTQSTIEAYSIVPGPTSGAVTNLRAVINSTDGKFISWQEIPNL